MPEAGVVWLRPAEDADGRTIMAIENEPAGNTMANVIPRSDAAFAAHWQRVLNDPSVVTRIIEFQDSGASSAVGFVTSFLVDLRIPDAGDAGSAERRCIGYRIGRAWWGRGIATRALSGFLDEAVPERPLWAITAAANPASQRVLAKCGFEIVARRWTPASERYPAGDELVFRLDG